VYSEFSGDCRTLCIPAPQRADQRLRGDFRETPIDALLQVGVFLRAGKEVAHELPEPCTAAGEENHPFDDGTAKPFSGASA